ncbi:MAG: hypothetical protein IT381_13175 [Deltaproteobacteria bacterium]|nr:hypothetical protein [Deltaproteobacteria bacterium]
MTRIGGDCRTTNDCTSGLVCIDSRCEKPCRAPADCGTGFVCTGEICVQSASIEAPCEGGCATGQSCVQGRCLCSPESCALGCCVSNQCIEVSDASCGANGSVCVACGGLTPTCIGGVCTSACDASACGLGCCSPGGCQPGLADTACGVSAACVDCTSSGAGHKCLNGQCACTSEADCEALRVCIGSTGRCSADCSGGQACRDGCCAGAGCRPGIEQTACGPAGGVCTDCTTNPQGRRCANGACGCADNADCVTSAHGSECLGGVCGCAASDDCPLGQACNQATHQCSSSCAGGLVCNGGCCDLTDHCVGGTGAAACGSAGALCKSCAGNSAGDECVNVGAGVRDCGCVSSPDCSDPKQPVCRGTGQCGCDVAADCPAGQACDTTTHTCEADCGAGRLCNGCCNGIDCLSGTANDQCGTTGGSCFSCQALTDNKACTTPAQAIGANRCGCTTASTHCSSLKACRSGLCSTNCSPVGGGANLACNGGCCDGSACQPGTSAGACGPIGGNCSACSGQASNKTCVNRACGCTAPSHCTASQCCSTFTDLCSAGNTQHACGNGGLMCDDCGARTCLGADDPGPGTNVVNACQCTVGGSPTQCSSMSSGTACQNGPGSTDFCGCNSAVNCSAGTCTRDPTNTVGICL